MSDTLRVVCVVGPTAAGKTDVAVALARRFPFDVISVDSAMVYRRMNVGTAKPDARILAEVPHALIDIRDPWESYSAGDFCVDADHLIRASNAAGRIPLLVGGTMLYFRALQHGLAELPRADADVRAELDRQAAERGWPALHRELAAIDPAAAARIAPADRQRIQRALEVYRLAGAPLSTLQAAAPVPYPAQVLRVALMPVDREGLYRRIERRFDAMVAAGFVDEVRELMALSRMSAAVPAMRAVGYRQLWSCLAGELEWDEARRRAIVASRRYAKRQLTWLRAENSRIVLDCNRAELVNDAIQAIETTDLFDAI